MYAKLRLHFSATSNCLSSPERGIEGGRKRKTCCLFCFRVCFSCVGLRIQRGGVCFCFGSLLWNMFAILSHPAPFADCCMSPRKSSEADEASMVLWCPLVITHLPQALGLLRGSDPSTLVGPSSAMHRLHHAPLLSWKPFIHTSTRRSFRLCSTAGASFPPITLCASRVLFPQTALPPHCYSS